MNSRSVIFVGSIFLSAFLLFLVQPLVTRMLLPVYGGSPAVWNTALVFFQVLLLFGYLYAFVLSRLRRFRVVVLVHSLVVATPVLVLPTAEAASSAGSAGLGAWPAATLLLTLTGLVAAPFFALSSNSSLVQWWWSLTPGKGREDPYWLYAASNVGSLTALLAYPFLIEPALGLAPQARAWGLGYLLFALVTLVVLGRVHRAGVRGLDGSHPSGIDLGRSALKSSGKRTGTPDPSPAPSRARIGGWVLRAAVASSLLLSVSTQITTDLAPTPLLWVVPLALYLLTFVLAFGMADRLRRPLLQAGVVVTMAGAVGLLLGTGRPSFWLTLLLSLATLFMGALLCHRDLAADRPGPRHLTAFYLWISVGGAVGGVLNSLVAPVVFDSVAEYPITLVALALLLHRDPGAGGWTRYRPGRRTSLLAGLTLVLPMAMVLAEVDRTLLVLGLMGLGSVWGLACSRYVGLVAVTVGFASLATLLGVGRSGALVTQERSFFGVVSVVDDGGVREMLHGTTVHGTQWLDERRRTIPTSYYHPEGPLGRPVASVPEGGRIGVVGLGTGALAAGAGPGRRLTFYEIDPLVERLAREHFTYLQEADGEVDVVLGDGRQTLQGLPDGTFDVLVVDAFSSDFVPIHLLTDEALTLYLDKVTREGLVLLHISNRHADLRRVVRGFGAFNDMQVLFADYSPSGQARTEGATRTLAAALSRSPDVLAHLSLDPDWTRFAADVPGVHWTDDHANLLSVLR